MRFDQSAIYKHAQHPWVTPVSSAAPNPVALGPVPLVAHCDLRDVGGGAVMCTGPAMIGDRAIRTRSRTGPRGGIEAAAEGELVGQGDWVEAMAAGSGEIEVSAR
jgi:hypothetical protein